MGGGPCRPIATPVERVFGMYVVDTQIGVWKGAGVIINFLFLYVALCNIAGSICIMTIALCIL